MSEKIIVELKKFQRSILAVRKYTAIPKMSLAVVIKGPDATAGLIPNLSKIKGVMVPVKEATNTTEINATETTKASLNSVPKTRLNVNTIPLKTNPFSIPINKTRNNLCRVLISITDLLAILCKITEED